MSWLLCGLAWGTVHFCSIRNSLSMVDLEPPEEDDKIGFGQYLAVFLLAVPMLSAIEAFTGESYLSLLPTHAESFALYTV